LLKESNRKKKEFRVHKSILAARSSVFDAMFSHDLEECKQNRVEIPDVDVDVFYEMLRFIYTGEVRDLDELAFEMFEAADKVRTLRL